MTDHTCGCLDGKPCEWLETGYCPKCPTKVESWWTACAPMVALVEARREAGRGGMCKDIAPAVIAVCEPPDIYGISHSPWCHLPKGHSGEHVCGEHRWPQLQDQVFALEENRRRLLTDVYELKAEAARWKRAAEKMADAFAETRTDTAENAAHCLAWALGEEKP
jgi:hypothetical protein